MLNVPLDRGCGESQYRAALTDAVLPTLHRYRPQFVLVSAGFDALAGDEIAHIRLEPESFAWITEALVDVAEQHAGGKLVSVLEGGYDLSQLGQAVAAHVRALRGRQFSPSHPESPNV
jgi:acetoin utilization deacetylase AcuC-like enzyme